MIERLKDLNIINDELKTIYEFDEYTLTELLCRFISTINDTVNQSNILEECYNYLLNEGLTIEVQTMLTKWYNDGTLENIINDTLLYNKAYKNNLSPCDFNDNIQECLDFASLNNYNVQFPSNKTYIIEDTIYLPNNVSIDFNNSTIKTKNDIIMLATKDREKLNNCKISNLRIIGANNINYTNNTGIKIASIYGIFDNIDIQQCYNGFVQHSENVEGNQVTNIYSNIRIKYNHGLPMKLGDNSNGKITDGWLENINLGSGNVNNDCHLYIGSCSGYFIKNIHTWGDAKKSLSLANIAHTNIEGLYIESFTESAIQLHMKSELNISNVKTVFNNDNSNIFNIYGASTILYNNVNINLCNLIIIENNSDYVNNIVFNSDGSKQYNINLTNCKIDVINAKLNGKPTNIKLTYSDLFNINKNQLMYKGNVVKSNIIYRINNTSDTVTIDLPINYEFETYDRLKLKIDITLFKYWNDSTSKARNVDSVYLVTKDKTTPSIRIFNEFEPIGFDTIPSYTFNDNILSVTFKTTNTTLTGFMEIEV